MFGDASIEIIQKCFHRCLHCSSCSTEQSEAMLPLQVVVHLIAGLHALGIDKICLSGGEPLLHPDVDKIVQEITKRHIRADIYSCGIVAQNGVFTAIPVEMLQSLKRAGLKTMIFNLPSIQEENYNLITQSSGHLPLALESIYRTVDCDISAEIHFVPMKLNLCEAPRIVKFAQKAGVRQVNFLKLMPHGRALENADQILPSDEEIVALQRQFYRLGEDGASIRIGLPLMEGEHAPPCHAVKEKLYIRFDGCVLGCEAFKYVTFRDNKNAEILPDSIWERDIQDIYHDSAYLRHSLNLISAYEGMQSGCENCPVQKYIKNRRFLDELHNS